MAGTESSKRGKSMSAQVQQLHKTVGRNDPCPCGSGKKYKKCCLPRHEEEEQLRRKLEEPEILSDKYFTVKEYISESGFPVVNLDYFLLELLNIIGSIIHKLGKPNPEQVKELLKKLLSQGRNFFAGCQKCTVGCLKEPMKRASLQSLKDKGLRLEEFPKVLQKPVIINLFYFEFVNSIMVALAKELESLLPEAEAKDIVSTVSASIFDFVTENCWGNCNNRCIKEYGKNAYCSFCSFGEDKLPCPKAGEISYNEICATEADMIH